MMIMIFVFVLRNSVFACMWSDMANDDLDDALLMSALAENGCSVCVVQMMLAAECTI